MLQENRTPEKGTQVVTGKNSRGLPKKKFFIIGSLLLVALVLIGILVTVLVHKKSDSNDQVAVKPIQYEETITPNAYGNFLAVAVKSFYFGGNTNGVDIPTHNYYPSTADLKDREWTKKNMQLDDRMHELITSGEVVYEPKGCNADQPSGEQNKCSDFVVKSGDSVLFDSTKKD